MKTHTPTPELLDAIELEPVKKLIVFDLDGTLAVSKAPLDAEMATLLDALLRNVKVAVISGQRPGSTARSLAEVSGHPDDDGG